MTNLEEDGYLTIGIKTDEMDPETEELLVVAPRLDVYEVMSVCKELQKAYHSRPSHEFYAAVVEAMMAWGYPKVSHRLADLFVNAVVEHYENLKKKDGSAKSAGSASSTASLYSPNGVTMATEGAATS